MAFRHAPGVGVDDKERFVKGVKQNGVRQHNNISHTETITIYTKQLNFKILWIKGTVFISHDFHH